MKLSFLSLFVSSFLALANWLQAAQPTISPIVINFVLEDTQSDPFFFTVSDAETPAKDLVISAFSSNPTLVPVSGILFGGADNERFGVVIPATNQTGVATITVGVRDGEGLTAFTEFNVKVLNVNDPPTISVPTKVVTGEVNSLIRVNFTVNDPDGLDNLLVVARTSNSGLIAEDTGMFIGDNGANRVLIITPRAGQTGSARITLTVADPTDAIATDFFDLIVSAGLPKAPTITSQPVSQNIQAGAPVIFSVSATGDAPISYQWQFKNANIDGARSAQLLINNVSAINEGAYRVIVSNNTGSVTSDPATLTIIAPPIILTQPASQTVIVENSASLSVEASGPPPFGYRWFFNATNELTEFNGSSFVQFEAIQLTNAGNYTVVINNRSGSVTSMVAVLTVVQRPNLAPSVSIASPAAGTKFIAPRNLRLVANASDFDGSIAKVDFLVGGTLAGTATSAPFALTLTNVPAGSYSITAVATDDRGATGGSVAVTVTGVADLGSLPGNLDGQFANLDPNGPVQAVSQFNDKVIVGGSFTAIGGVARGRVARLNADGTVDTTFNPAGGGADSSVNALAVNKTDGKVIIVGGFTVVNGVARNGIARLNSDGSLDTTFAPGNGADNVVYSVALQTDGKVLVGGAFGTVNGLRRAGLARLNTDGSVDTFFEIPVGLAGGTVTRVNAIAVQTDGKILAGGEFTSASGASHNRLVRLESNGTVDATFTIGTGANNTVNSIVVAADGKVLVGGAFTQFQTLPRGGVVRLNADGTIDPTFEPGAGASGPVNVLLAQTNGKIFVAGEFSTWNGLPRGGLARLNANGGLDVTFDTGTGVAGGFVPRVIAASLQGDGKFVIGGDFTIVNGFSVSYLARIWGDAGTVNPPTAARFTAIKALSATSIELSLSGKAGQTYAIQSSADLVQWTLLQTVTPLANNFTFTDSPAAGIAKRFYRVVSQ